MRNSVSSQKFAGNAEGAKRPTAGDEGCEVRAQNLAPLRHPEGGRRATGRVPPFIEKLRNSKFRGAYNPAFLVPLLGLVFSHVFTALIQFRPFLFQGFLQASFASNSEFFSLLPFVIASTFLLLLFLKKEPLILFFQEACSRFGKIPSAFLLLGLLLPQRLMDSNSGYVQIFNDSPLYAILVFLDILRSFCVFHLFWYFFKTAWQEASTTKTNEHFSIVTYCTIIATFFFLTVGVQLFVLEGIPHVQDEISQHWQARVFSSGRPAAPATSCRESFSSMGLVDNGIRLFSFYQPLPALFKSILIPINCEAVLNPILGTLTIFLLFYLLRREERGIDRNTYLLKNSREMRRVQGARPRGMRDAKYGRKILRPSGIPKGGASPPLLKSYCNALILTAFSPFFLVMMSGQMNHGIGLLLLVSTLVGLSWFSESFLLSLIVCGFSAGLLVMTRRVDGACLVLAAVLAILGSHVSVRRKFGFIFLFSVILALLFSLQVLLNKAHSGDPLQMIRQVQNVTRDFPKTSIFALLQNSIDNLFGFSVFAFGGVLAGFMGIGFLLQTSFDKERLVYRFLSLHFFVTIGTYGIYDYQDFCYGPRFFFNLLPAAIIGTSLMLDAFGKHFSAASVKMWFRVAILVAAFAFINQVWSVLGNNFWNTDSSFQKFVSKNLSGPTVVFIKSATRKKLETVWLFRELKVPREITESVVRKNSLDFDGLNEKLLEIQPPYSKQHEDTIEKFMRNSVFHGPAEFEINESEVIRLNSPNFFTLSQVFCLDLGDKPNQDILDRLASHTPVMISKSGKGFIIAPYKKIGFNRF